jgi:hypothetical protein
MVHQQLTFTLQETAMKKTILTFGLISGAISSLMMIATMPFQDKLGHSYILGYTTLVLSFLLVFFGIRSYRDNIGGGQITFMRALGVGLAITLISCVFYVVTWEIVYFNFMHDFMDKYGAHEIEKARAAGATQAALEAQRQQFQKLKVMYENPFFNAALTFLEPAPVGLVITLISALILKRKQRSDPAPAPLTAS